MKPRKNSVHMTLDFQFSSLKAPKQLSLSKWRRTKLKKRNCEGKGRIPGDLAGSPIAARSQQELTTKKIAMRLSAADPELCCPKEQPVNEKRRTSWDWSCAVAGRDQNGLLGSWPNLGAYRQLSKRGENAVSRSKSPDSVSLGSWWLFREYNSSGCGFQVEIESCGSRKSWGLWKLHEFVVSNLYFFPCSMLSIFCYESWLLR